MVVSSCQHLQVKKHGRDRKGNQRYKCTLCGQTFVKQTNKPLGNLRISLKEAVAALNLLLEGMSIRATARITGTCKKTICDLILAVGANCERFMESTIRNVNSLDIQADEIWSFVGMKEKQRFSGGHTGEEGNSWTFLAIDRDTKLVLAHHIAEQRNNEACAVFLAKLQSAITGRFQLSTDGLGAYSLNVPFTFKGDVDFGQLIKNFQGGRSTGRYSPGKIIKAEKRPMYGEPDVAKICTSHIERMNLSIRMHLRRFTRLTNAHSKSLKHHSAMQAIFFAWYNFSRNHETLKQTPAMAAGLVSKRWSVRELIEQAAAAKV